MARGLRIRSIAATTVGVLGLVASLLALDAAPSAAATTVHVNAASGVDSGTCGAVGTPCKTITQGLAKAAAGDTVQVASGTYAERVEITKPVSLIGAGTTPGTATEIDGGSSTSLPGPGQVHVSSPGAVRVSSLVIGGIGSAGAGNPAIGVLVDGPGTGSSATLTDLRVGGGTDSVRCTASGAAVVVERSYLSLFSGTGIAVDGCTGPVTVRGTSVRGGSTTTAASTGILVTGGTVGATIASNVVGTFRGRAVRIVPSASGVPTATRLVGNSIGQTGVLNETGAVLDAEDNWWGCAGGPFSGGGFCSSVVGSVDADPSLVLQAAATPTLVTPGQVSTVTANLRHNTTGALAEAWPTAPGDDITFSWPSDVPPTFPTPDPQYLVPFVDGVGTIPFSSTKAGNRTVTVLYGDGFVGGFGSAAVTIEVALPLPSKPPCKILNLPIRLPLLPALLLCL